MAATLRREIPGDQLLAASMAGATATSASRFVARCRRFLCAVPRRAWIARFLQDETHIAEAVPERGDGICPMAF